MFTYARHLTSPAVKRIITRSLPTEGEILVKVGDKVRPETVIGKCFRSSGFRTFPLAELLGVPSSKVEDYLVKPLGSRIYKGTLVAQAKQLFGLRRVEFLSPMDGILKEIFPYSGQLSIEYPPSELKLAAGIGGKVVEVIPKKEVKIGGILAEVSGVVSAGMDREGSIRVTAGPDISIAPAEITASCQGQILVGGSLLTKEIIYKCLAVRVRGVVCGGMHFKDYQEIITRTRGEFEDIGLTILITEGFGNRPMRRQIFELLEKHQGRYAMILRDKNRLVIPLATKEDEKEAYPSQAHSLIAKNQKAQFLSPAYLGRECIIEEVLKEPVQLESGIFAQCARVKVGEKEIQVPVRNLEILE